MRRPLRPLFGAMALAFAAACSGGSAPVLPGASAAGTAPALKGAARENLLYVSDDTSGTVYMYSYPWGKLKGKLTNFAGPSSICTDDAGHVWILESQTSEIVEYDHGGTKPIATLHDPGYWPNDCAVNPKSGDLAVANVFMADAPGSSPGNLVVYEKAKGRPHAFTTTTMNNEMFVTYDPDGNLYVDGFAAYNEFALVELPAGSKSLTAITVDQSISPGDTADVKWDGKYLAIGDASVNTLYQIKVSGTRGKTVGRTTLDGVSSGYLSHICFPKFKRKTGQPGRVIVPNNTTVGYWAYPAGGNVKRRVVRSLLFALGCAVSEGS